jgi:hypothetical protein
MFEHLLSFRKISKIDNNPIAVIADSNIENIDLEQILNNIII